MELLEHNEINDHAITLMDGKQLLYEPIHSLQPVEMETLKTYIAINLVNNFIKPSKSMVDIPIFFIQKSNNSVCLYVNYWCLNNLIIKIQYLLPLINKFLYRLGRVKLFT